MTITRDELIEKLALMALNRLITAEGKTSLDDICLFNIEDAPGEPIVTGVDGHLNLSELMRDALVAIDEAGLVIAPKYPTYSQLTAADTCLSVRKSDIYHAMIEEGKIL
jgi:hypothetical protein